MSNEWTDELKAQVVESYEKADPKPETSTEIVAEIAEDVGMTVNGVRAVLVRAGVYVKKDATKAATGTKATSTRVNKADAIAKLEELITANELEVDESITSKLTGKAAVYFAGIFEKLTAEEE